MSLPGSKATALNYWMYNPAGQLVGEGRVDTFPCLIGRDQECDIRVQFASSSRRHAAIEARGAELFIVDLDSRNGMRRQDGTTIKEYLVEDRSEFMLGDHRLVFGVERGEFIAEALELSVVVEVPKPKLPPLPKRSAPAAEPAPAIEELSVSQTLGVVGIAGVLLLGVSFLLFATPAAALNHFVIQAMTLLLFALVGAGVFSLGQQLQDKRLTPKAFFVRWVCGVGFFQALVTLGGWVEFRSLGEPGFADGLKVLAPVPLVVAAAVSARDALGWRAPLRKIIFASLGLGFIWTGVKVHSRGGWLPRSQWQVSELDFHQALYQAPASGAAAPTAQLTQDLKSSVRSLSGD